MFEFLINIYLKEEQERSKNERDYDLATACYSSVFNADENEYNSKPNVNYHMAWAIKCLLMKPQPSSTNKIEISLYEYETKSYPYLWTALMILGMVLPNKFGNESIKSRASFRDYLDTQQGFFSRFSSNSIYEREFKIHLNEEMVKYFLEEFLSKYKKNYITSI